MRGMTTYVISVTITAVRTSVRSSIGNTLNTGPASSRIRVIKG